MKFLIPAMAIFASTALAAKYEAGTICHSNIECEKNCLDKQYIVANEDGGYVFVCDSSVADPVQWYNLDCKNQGADRTDADATEAVCKTLGGKFCNYNCVLSDKRSVDDDNRAKWSGSCGGNLRTEFYQVKDEETATVFC